MIKVAALVVVFIILASVFVFAACKAKTPRSITDKFENLAEDGSFNNESGGKGDSVENQIEMSLSTNKIPEEYRKYYELLLNDVTYLRKRYSGYLSDNDLDDSLKYYQSICFISLF